MKTTLRLEELALMALGIFFMTEHNLGWSAWVWLLLFFAPDISMLGYLLNRTVGAFTYNLFHHRAVAIMVMAIGYFLQQEPLLSIGALLLAHASFDRFFGYGLKYSTGFKDTHLGSLNKNQTRAYKTAA